MQRWIIGLVVAVSGVMSVRVASAYPGFVGDTVSLTRKIPSTGFTYGPFVFVAQNGPADTVALTAGNNLYVNVEDSSLLFSFGPTNGSGGPFPPMGHFILFQDLSPTAPAISGLTYETDLSGFVASNISFTAHSVTTGYGGIDYSGGQHLTVNLQFVPEPSTLVLFGAGAIGLLAWAWRPRRSERQRKTCATSRLHFERKGYTMLNRILAIVALSAMFPVGAAMATPITLSDLNATATFDFAGGGSGMTDWTVDHVSQLYQQWFWYRIGNTGPELPINSLTLDTVKVSDGNENPGDDRVVAYYSGSGLKVSLDHVLTGGGSGTGVSDVAETITIKNITASAIDFHFFQFVDLNLMDTPHDTSVEIIPTGHAAKQAEGNYAVAETVDTPPPSRYQADYAANIRTLLTNGGPDDLNNQASAANGDLGWAFQWDVSLAPGQAFLISKDKRLGFVPEPGTLVLLAAGLLGLLAYAWRRRRS